MEDRQDAPLAPAVEFLLRERLTGRPLPKAAEGIASLWRDEVNARGADTLDKLIDHLHDQEQFAKTIQDLIRDLTKGDEVGEDQSEQDQESEEESDQNNQENSAEDGESGEETEGATMEEIEAGDAEDMEGEETNVSVDSDVHCARIFAMATMRTASSTRRSPRPMTKWPRRQTCAIRKS